MYYSLSVVYIADLYTGLSLHVMSGQLNKEIITKMLNTYVV